MPLKVWDRGPLCVLPSGIFELLEQTPPGKGGEIQPTDALHMLARKNKMLGFAFDGRRFDTGNALGLLCASMFKAAQPELREGLIKMIDEIKATTK